MRQFPEELTTPRLRLRPVRLEDAEALNTAIGESFPELHPWVPWAVEMPSLADTRAFCEESLRKLAEGSAWNLLMLSAADGTLLGASGYPRLSWAVPAFEIGYWCRTPMAGHGYVSEAAAALTRLAFDRLDAGRVELRIDDANLRSIAVAERLGFALEGVHRNQSRNNAGELCDTRVYALTDVAGLRIADNRATR